MRLSLLEVLACPACARRLRCEPAPGGRCGEEIEEGQLRCSGCAAAYPVTNGIPRFVDPRSYASSFGLQWNRFKAEQIDAINGFGLSAQRFADETGWDPAWMRGKWILDAGCGAGRFLDVASRAGADVVGVDLTDAVDAARANLKDRPNVHLVQADLYRLPFVPGAFDGCYCLGVIQHTPDPHAALRALPRTVKPGGRLAFFIYERRRWTMLYSKYLVRPLTSRMNDRLLLGLITALMPVLFPLTELLFRLPGVLGKAFAFAIPVSNYVGVNRRTNGGLTWRQRYRWAIMDTFDMLAPRYDQPQRFDDVRRTLTQAGVQDLARTAPYALCLQGRRAEEPVPAAAAGAAA